VEVAQGWPLESAQFLDEHLAVALVAALPGLDGQSLDAAVEQRSDHAAEALGSDVGITALAVEGQRRDLTASHDGIENLSATTVTFGDEVPPPLPGQAERADKPAERVDVPVGDDRDAHVVSGPAGGLVDERLSGQLAVGRLAGASSSSALCCPALGVGCVVIRCMSSNLDGRAHLGPARGAKSVRRFQARSSSLIPLPESGKTTNGSRWLVPIGCICAGQRPER
jgi:hypothetical protein